MSLSLLSQQPVPALLARLRDELAVDFAPSRPVRIARAPGRLDVMGGIADYTGSLVCEMPLDRAAAVAIQERDDRQVQVFSFNLFDEHKPFTLRIPLDALAAMPTADLRREFAEPGRQWAAYLAGCLHVLHVAGLVDLAKPSVAGLNIALLSTVPLGAGVSSSAAIEVATMSVLVDHLRISRDASILSMDLAALCQRVENDVVGAPCGIMDQATSVAGLSGQLLRMKCQPHELLAPLAVPPNMRFVGIDTGVRHSVGGGQYGKTRCAAFMAHKIILATMKHIGAAAGRELVADPLNGYLANLDPEDYKRIFRSRLPDQIRGGEFLLKYGPTIDTATRVHPDTTYEIVHAADHHVLEARRVRKFSEFLEEANRMAPSAIGSRDYGLTLDKAGHLMYASHQSYMMDAKLGSEEADLLVMLLRQRERQGLYGARITGGGLGGTVALLCERGDIQDKAIASAMADYAGKTGKTPTLFAGSSDGAWQTGSAIV
ncbi:galactokinase [Humisphaera borealis]|uniref:GHMP kinase n=1 Tax=Humisphaera borealis TaxID=2807512 RepID=A0A7M2X0Y3_9BACT|nr:galactokinase family protein [Humisphaera borealis]QOV91353.1 GHMP kinase [Humisphaera borealis]